MKLNLVVGPLVVDQVLTLSQLVKLIEEFRHFKGSKEFNGGRAFERHYKFKGNISPGLH